MKAVFAFLAMTLALSSFSFAGPEEHLAAQICFVLKGPQPTSAIPERVCIEDITLSNLETSSVAISIYSYFNGKYFDGVWLDYIARRNENGFSFKAKNVLSDISGSGCDYAEKVTLKVSGRADNDGLVDVSLVSVTAILETAIDSCHSTPHIQEFEYIRN
ncbi:MAG: hypothetical protein ACKOX6_09275 [Bdellovibrio sp.]